MQDLNTPRSYLDRLPAGAQNAEPEPEPQPGTECTSLAPLDQLSTALLTDMYQITMAYSYWFNQRHNDHAVYDLFFRKNPFGGEYTIFCGLEECLRLVDSFRFTDEQVAYLRTVMPGTEEGFFVWLRTVDCSQVKIHAQKEGSVTFPRVPLLRVEGPLAICQMLETPLLNLCNYPSLVATNAARLKTAAGPGKGLIEIGLRAAQGPDGGISASRYSFIGGFDGTSNVQAGEAFSILPKGSHHHAYVMAYNGIEDLTKDDGGREICTSTGEVVDIVEQSLFWAKKLQARCGQSAGNQGELAAFCAYARSYPTNFLAQIDTYDALKSGLSNFLAVSLTLHAAGYAPVGIALDSGDLAYQSKQARNIFRKVADSFDVPSFRDLRIVGSNGIDVNTLESLRVQHHEIDIFCIGTNAVTCEAQPALGAVYKLCEINGKSCIKVSHDVEKISIPGRKIAYRLFNKSLVPVTDLLVEEPFEVRATVTARAGPGAGKPGARASIADEVPTAGHQILCKHPFDDVKRAFVTPSKVVPLHSLVYGPLESTGEAGKEGKSQLLIEFPTIDAVRNRVMAEMAEIRPDHRRILNPTPYKISVTNQLHLHLHALWQEHVPITDLS